MRHKDARLKLMNDILSGMKVLKLYAWEPSMRKMVADIRRKELTELRKLYFISAIIDTSFHFAPILVCRA